MLNTKKETGSWFCFLGLKPCLTEFQGFEQCCTCLRASHDCGSQRSRDTVVAQHGRLRFVRFGQELGEVVYGRRELLPRRDCRTRLFLFLLRAASQTMDERVGECVKLAGDEVECSGACSAAVAACSNTALELHARLPAVCSCAEWRWQHHANPCSCA